MIDYFDRLNTVKRALLDMLEDVARKGSPSADVLAVRLANVLRMAEGLEVKDNR